MHRNRLNSLAHTALEDYCSDAVRTAGAQDLDRRKDMGFPMGLPSPGLMPLPDASQAPQPVTGTAGRLPQMFSASSDLPLLRFSRFLFNS